MTEKGILRFGTKGEANDWLAANNQTGMVRESVGGFIIVRAIAGAIAAFTSPTTGIILTEW